MNTNKYITIGAVALALSGCATLERTTMLGVGFGAATGTAIGLAVEKSAGSALIGAAIGTVVGGTAFYLAGLDRQKKKDPVDDKKAEAPPMILAPEVTCYEVGAKIENGSKWISPIKFVKSRSRACSRAKKGRYGYRTEEGIRQTKGALKP